MVEREIPNCSAMVAMGTSPDFSKDLIVRRSFAVSFFGRPPLRPRARAAFSPAIVPSRIKLRSNSANAPDR